MVLGSGIPESRVYCRCWRREVAFQAHISPGAKNFVKNAKQILALLSKRQDNKSANKQSRILSEDVKQSRNILRLAMPHLSRNVWHLVISAPCFSYQHCPGFPLAILCLH